VDAERRALDFAASAQETAVVTNLHQTAGGDLRPMHAKRELQIPVALPWDSECQVIENAFAETLPIREAVRCGKIHPCLPHRGAWYEVRKLGRGQSHNSSLRGDFREYAAVCLTRKALKSSGRGRCEIGLDRPHQTTAQFLLVGALPQ